MRRGLHAKVVACLVTGWSRASCGRPVNLTEMSSCTKSTFFPEVNKRADLQSVFHRDFHFVLYLTKIASHAV